MDRSVVSGVVLIAYGVDLQGIRRVLGVSTEISEAEVQWRNSLKSFVERGLHGLQMIASDAYLGLKSAIQSIFRP